MKKINCYVFIVLSQFLIYSCNNYELKDIKKKIKAEFKSNKEMTTLRLDTISAFLWDEVLIAGPYVDLEKIEEELNYNFRRFPNTIKNHDNYILIGFIYKNTGVQFMELNRALLPDSIYKGDKNNYKFYWKSESVFPVKRSELREIKMN